MERAFLMHYYNHDIYQRELQEIIENNHGLEFLRNKSLVITGARGLIGSMLVDAVMYANQRQSIDCNVFAILRDIENGRKRFVKYETLPLFHIIQADINRDEIKIDSDIDFFIHAAKVCGKLLRIY